MIDVLEDDEDHILIIKFPFSQQGFGYSFDGKKPPIVSKLNVNSGKQKTVERLKFRSARPLTDKNGEIRFVSYQTEDGLTKSAYRPNKKADWQLLSDAFELDDDLSVVGLNDAGNAVFLYGPHGEEGFRTVFRFDFEENIYEPLFTDLDADIVNWLSDPDTGEIVIGSSRRGKVKHHYTVRESRYQGLHRALAKAYGDQTLSVMSRSVDGKDMILRASSDTNPGSIFIFDTEAKRAEFFWANRSWMDPNQMRPMQIDEVISKDGFSIPVRLTLPATDEPAPLIVNPHGGPHGISDDWAFNYETQLLASRGYAVLQVNFRGSGGFGKKFEDAGHMEWGGKMIEDLAEAARWAMSRDDVDQERVCAYGGSYGAYASYMLAVREPEMLRCVIGYVGVYDLNIMYSTGDIPKSWGGAGYLERVIGREKAALDEFSPTTHAARIKATPMLIHGEDDIRAPIDHAYAMRDALEEVGKDPKWLKIDDSGHGAGSLENRLELYESLLGFLDSNLM
jgi:dienelactone hydrolase